MSPTTSDPTATPDALLRAGDAPAALCAARRVAEQNPGDVQNLYILAVSQRYAGQPHDALETIAQLLDVAPEFARAYQERGHLYRFINAPDAAIRAYEQAIALNPALHAGWKNLAELYQSTGESGKAANASQQHTRLQALPRVLLSVASLLHEGKLFKAERLCRAHLKAHPTDVEGMRLLALLGAKLHVLDDAEFLLESALTFAPDYVPARIDYINVLQQRQKFAQALANAEELRANDPPQPVFEVIYANACAAAGNYSDAIDIYLQESARQPRNATLFLALGHAYKTIGETGRAVDSYREAARIRPDFGDAYWSLANLKTYRFTRPEIETMVDQESRADIGLEDRFHLCFALGRAYEGRKDAAASFDYYTRGNRLKKRQSTFDGAKLRSEFERQRQICTRSFFAAREGWGCQDPAPIFIVGLPRAGSTLLEQILASHSQVDGTLELPNILATVRRLQGRQRVDDDARYPAVLADLDADACRELGQRYIEETVFHRRGARFFTDKMPNNFRHVGLIHLMLPNARIIDARRDPIDCCFSGFKQLFAEGQEFTYSLEDIGHYYADYVNLMNHWNSVLPGRILTVRHEHVVADLETQVRRILTFCGLPFETDCVNFHETQRAVRTASSEQVRQPIFQSAKQWTPFRDYLTPLTDIVDGIDH